MPIFFNKVTPVDPATSTKRQNDGKTFAELLAQQRRAAQQQLKPIQRQERVERSAERAVEKPVRNNKTSAYMRDLTNK